MTTQAIPSSCSFLPTAITTSSCWPTSCLDKVTKWLKDHPYVTIALIIITACIAVGTFSSPDVSFLAKALVGIGGAIVLLITIPIGLEWKKLNFPVALTDEAKLERTSLYNAALYFVNNNQKAVKQHRDHIMDLFDGEKNFTALPELKVENLELRSSNLVLTPQEVSQSIMRGSFPNAGNDPKMALEFVALKIRKKGTQEAKVLILYPALAKYQLAPQWMHSGDNDFFGDTQNPYFHFITYTGNQSTWKTHPHLQALKSFIKDKGNATYELVS